MIPRKRLYSSGEGSDLPLATNTALPTPTSSGRLAPLRSQSSSAAYALRQRISPTSSPVKSMSFSYQDLRGDSWDYLPLSKSSSSSLPKGDSNLSHYMVQALFVVVFVALAAFGVFMQESNVSLEYTLVARDHEIEHHLNHLHELEKKLQRLSNEKVVLNNQLIQLEQRPAIDKEGLEAQRRAFHLEHANSMVHQGIQREAQRLVQEKFGPGPTYYVEMKLSFPTESNLHVSVGDTILLETASMQDMPHSVNLFLEQVAHGLYDGTTFYEPNAPHVLLAGPGADVDAQAKFRDFPSLKSVLFQEYSPKFPHVPYSLGYAGRPGGPNFYFNMQDNTQSHGPGGQHHHYNKNDGIIGTDADPCFAKIIEGQAVVDHIHDTHAALRQDGSVMNPVTIASMRVIRHQDQAQA